MREKLAPLEGRKTLFYGTFSKYGWRSFRGKPVGKTLLLVHVLDKDGREVTDHLWFHVTKGFDGLDLKPGQMVSFEARVTTYTKHRGNDWDYKLIYPERLKKVSPDTLREDGQSGLI